MVNAAALLLTPTTTAASAQAAERARPAFSPAFSFDEAVASARRNAARALEIHGGAPTGTVTRAADAAQAEAAVAERSTPARAATQEAQSANRPSPAAAAQPPAPVPAAAAPSGSPLPAAAAATPAVPVAAATAAQPAPTAPTVAAPVRDAAARAKTEIPRLAPPGRAPALSLTEFAAILARRLDGASQFDLRLDPPSLGGVEGRLTLTDDGAATLALAFDNSAAFDLFSRDEAALRQALANAGFDLPRENLQMSIRAAPRKTSARAADAPAASSPVIIAPLHRGLIDIRA
jgi:flagellar hook-length control protein FliK